MLLYNLLLLFPSILAVNVFIDGIVDIETSQGFLTIDGQGDGVIVQGWDRRVGLNKEFKFARNGSLTSRDAVMYSSYPYVCYMSNGYKWQIYTYYLYIYDANGNNVFTSGLLSYYELKLLCDVKKNMGYVVGRTFYAVNGVSMSNEYYGTMFISQFDQSGSHAWTKYFPDTAVYQNWQYQKAFYSPLLQTVVVSAVFSNQMSVSRYLSNGTLASRRLFTSSTLLGTGVNDELLIQQSNQIVKFLPGWTLSETIGSVLSSEATAAGYSGSTTIAVFMPDADTGDIVQVTWKNSILVFDTRMKNGTSRELLVIGNITSIVHQYIDQQNLWIYGSGPDYLLGFSDGANVGRVVGVDISQPIQTTSVARIAWNATAFTYPLISEIQWLRYFNTYSSIYTSTVDEANGNMILVASGINKRLRLVVVSGTTGTILLSTDIDPNSYSFDPKEIVIDPVTKEIYIFHSNPSSIYLYKYSSDGSSVLWNQVYGSSGSKYFHAKWCSQDDAVVFAGQTNAPFKGIEHYNSPGSIVFIAVVSKSTGDLTIKRSYHAKYTVQVKSLQLNACGNFGFVWAENNEQYGFDLIYGNGQSPVRVERTSVSSYYLSANSDILCLSSSNNIMRTNYSVWQGGDSLNQIFVTPNVNFVSLEIDYITNNLVKIGYTSSSIIVEVATGDNRPLSQHEIKAISPTISYTSFNQKLGTFSIFGYTRGILGYGRSYGTTVAFALTMKIRDVIAQSPSCVTPIDLTSSFPSEVSVLYHTVGKYPFLFLGDQMYINHYYDSQIFSSNSSLIKIDSITDTAARFQFVRVPGSTDFIRISCASGSLNVKRFNLQGQTIFTITTSSIFCADLKAQMDGENNGTLYVEVNWSSNDARLKSYSTMGQDQPIFTPFTGTRALHSFVASNQGYAVIQSTPVNRQFYSRFLNSTRTLITLSSLPKILFIDYAGNIYAINDFNILIKYSNNQQISQTILGPLWKGDAPGIQLQSLIVDPATNNLITIGSSSTCVYIEVCTQEKELIKSKKVVRRELLFINAQFVESTGQLLTKVMYKGDMFTGGFNALNKAVILSFQIRDGSLALPDTSNVESIADKLLQFSKSDHVFNFAEIALSNFMSIVYNPVSQQTFILDITSYQIYLRIIQNNSIKSSTSLGYYYGSSYSCGMAVDPQTGDLYVVLLGASIRRYNSAMNELSSFSISSWQESRTIIDDVIWNVDGLEVYGRSRGISGSLEDLSTHKPFQCRLSFGNSGIPSVKYQYLMTNFKRNADFSLETPQLFYSVPYNFFVQKWIVDQKQGHQLDIFSQDRLIKSIRNPLSQMYAMFPDGRFISVSDLFYDSNTQLIIINNQFEEVKRMPLWSQELFGISLQSNITLATVFIDSFANNSIVKVGFAGDFVLVEYVSSTDDSVINTFRIFGIGIYVSSSSFDDRSGVLTLFGYYRGTSTTIYANPAAFTACIQIRQPLNDIQVLKKRWGNVTDLFTPFSPGSNADMKQWAVLSSNDISFSMTNFQASTDANNGRFLVTANNYYLYFYSIANVTYSYSVNYVVFNGKYSQTDVFSEPVLQNGLWITQSTQLYAYISTSSSGLSKVRAYKDLRSSQIWEQNIGIIHPQNQLVSIVSIATDFYVAGFNIGGTNSIPLSLGVPALVLLKISRSGDVSLLYRLELSVAPSNVFISDLMVVSGDLILLQYRIGTEWTGCLIKVDGTLVAKQTLSAPIDSASGSFGIYGNKEGTELLSLKMDSNIAQSLGALWSVEAMARVDPSDRIQVFDIVLDRLDGGFIKIGYSINYIVIEKIDSENKAFSIRSIYAPLVEIETFLYQPQSRSLWILFRTAGGILNIDYGKSRWIAGYVEMDGMPKKPQVNQEKSAEVKRIEGKYALIIICLMFIVSTTFVLY